MWRQNKKVEKKTTKVLYETESTYHIHFILLHRHHVHKMDVGLQRPPSADLISLKHPTHQQMNATEGGHKHVLSQGRKSYI